MFSTSIFGNASSSRPTTRDGVDPLSGPPNLLTKDRKTSFSRKSSLSGSRRRGSSFGNGPNAFVTDATAPPALPDYALAAAAKIVPRAEVGKQGDHVQTPVSADGGFAMLTRTNTGSTAYLATAGPPGAAFAGIPPGYSAMWQQTEANMIHQQIVDVANKRISTLDYLRKAYVASVGMSYNTNKRQTRRSSVLVQHVSIR